MCLRIQGFLVKSDIPDPIQKHFGCFVRMEMRNIVSKSVL